MALRTGINGLRTIALAGLLLVPAFASAAQGPGVTDGTAEPITQATAAAMALVMPVAIVVFAIARFLGGRD